MGLTVVVNTFWVLIRGRVHFYDEVFLTQKRHFWKKYSFFDIKIDIFWHKNGISWKDNHIHGHLSSNLDPYPRGSCYRIKTYNPTKD